MTKSNQTLNPNFLFFLFLFFLPLLQAYKKCSSSEISCGLDHSNRISIRFPFCDHPQFNLTCIDLNTTILQLPMSGPFLVTRIRYYDQEIRINDPEKCLAKRLLTFNTSGSPFIPRYLVDYTFLICPNKVINRWDDPIACLSNSTHSFLATSDLSLVTPLLPSCEIVKTVSVPVRWLGYRGGFLSNEQDLLLKWDSPDCGVCERRFMRCGFKKIDSLQVKCFGNEKPGLTLSKELLMLIISLSVLGGIALFYSCIAFHIYESNRLVSRRTLNTDLAAATVTQRPDEVIVVARGLDEFIIDSLKTIELGDSRRLPGTNALICSICLSEYASKDILRCLPDCDHCFHVHCIDPWLKIHGSCPICRNSRTLNQLVYDV